MNSYETDYTFRLAITAPYMMHLYQSEGIGNQ